MVKGIIVAGLAMLAPLADAQAGPGLSGAYWVGGYGSGPGISGTPTATFITTTVCFPACGTDTPDSNSLSNFLGVPNGYSSDLSTNFNGINNHALTLTGYLNIASTGTYDLSLFSDDGSYMYIDGNLVVNDGGDHGPQTSTHFGYSLAAGQHSLLIYQEENGGGTALSAYINGQALGGDYLSTTIGVPEPASWAMMVGGFGLVGGAMRSRKRAVAFT